jgi:hypothetical protein
MLDHSIYQHEVSCVLQGKDKTKCVSTCEEAAGMIGSMAAGNAPNQDAFRAAGALPLLLGLVLTADKSTKVSVLSSQTFPAGSG